MSGKNIAIDKTLAQLQKIYNLVGPYGGYIKTEGCRDLYLLIESVRVNSVPALIGFFTDVNEKQYYDPMYDLILDIHDGEIRQIEVKKYYSKNLMGELEIYPNGCVYHNQKYTGQNKNLVEEFSKFMKEITEASPYVDDSVVHKFAKAYDGSVYKK